MRLGTCIPCQYGSHKDHYEVIQAVPEGMMGGARCTCKGECTKWRPRSALDLIGHGYG